MFLTYAPASHQVRNGVISKCTYSFHSGRRTLVNHISVSLYSPVYLLGAIYQFLRCYWNVTLPPDRKSEWPSHLWNKCLPPAVPENPLAHTNVGESHRQIAQLPCMVLGLVLSDHFKSECNPDSMLVVVVPFLLKGTGEKYIICWEGISYLRALGKENPLCPWMDTFQRQD